MRQRTPVSPDAIGASAKKLEFLRPHEGASERERIIHMLKATIEARGLSGIDYFGTPHNPRKIELDNDGKPRLGVIKEAIEDLALALGFGGTTRIYSVLFQNASLGIDGIQAARETVSERLREKFSV